MIHLTINPGRVVTHRRQPFAKSTLHGGPGRMPIAEYTVDI
jgi:hypothetical protein